MKKLVLLFGLVLMSSNGAYAYPSAYCSQQLNFCNESLGKAKQKLRSKGADRDAIMLKAGKTPGCKRWLCDCSASKGNLINESDYSQKDLTFFKGSLFIKSGSSASKLKGLVCSK